MQIKLILSNENIAEFPLNYNYQLQSAIYNLLKNNYEFSKYLHDIGFGQAENGFKLFTFSGLKGHYRLANKKIFFDGDIFLEIRSISKQFCEVLENSLLENGSIKLFNKVFKLKMIEITDLYIKNNQINILTISPIVAKLSDLNGKSIYYSPDCLEFYKIINSNFINKYNSFYGEFPKSEISIFPTNQVKKIVTKYKGIWITAYHGNFTLSGNNENLNFVYNTGLGCKNSQGFGMFDLK